MSTTIRAFVAVRIHATPLLRGVLDELSRIGRPVKPVAPENLHVTLKFLGETDPSWIDRTCELLDDVASQLPVFDVTLRGLGTFPKPSRPSVIWTDIQPPDPMRELAAAVEHELTTFGFSAEPRPFHPHITLARIKARPPQELATLVESHANTVFASMRIGEIELMQSRLSPQGATYSTLHTATLHAPAGTPR